jgi:hypothetical protein
MAEPASAVGAADISPWRSWIVRQPIATFLVLVYATTAALVFVPKELTEPGLLPGGATPYGVLENVLSSIRSGTDLSDRRPSTALRECSGLRGRREMAENLTAVALTA